MWVAGYENPDEWVQVEFDRPVTVYGLITGGSKESYVTSYYVLVSSNGVTFSYIENEQGKPKVCKL